MALTEEQLQHYYCEGYVVVPGLIPSASIAALLAAAPVLQGTGGGWGAQVYDHRRPETQAGIHRLLVEPGIVDAARSIFGAAHSTSLPPSATSPPTKRSFGSPRVLIV